MFLFKRPQFIDIETLLTLRNVHPAVSLKRHQSSAPKHKTSKRKELKANVVPKIGLEIHAQLKLSSKLFSRGGFDVLALPNSQLNFFDVSLPGTLPKLNYDALKSAIATGLALNCTIQDTIHFDRKNYFYTDMPAGYQITQYNQPIAINGYLDFMVSPYRKITADQTKDQENVKHSSSKSKRRAQLYEPYIKRSRIDRIQLEQDSAKSLVFQAEDGNKSRLVDYNRCGIALVEIVFAPDLTSHDEATSLIQELILYLKTLGTCDCLLNEGSLRVDANVSIDSIDGEKVANPKRVELKNVNSLRFLSYGIQYETLRQAQVIEDGQEVLQETRTYEPKSKQTKPLRMKEESIDYRYVHEPSIPPLRVGRELVAKIREQIPKIPPFDARSV